MTSVDCAPFGSGIDPGRSPHTRRRNRLLNAVLQRGPLKPIQDALDDALAGLGLPATADSYFEQVTKFDITFIWRCRPSNTRDASCPRTCASSDRSGRPIRKRCAYRPGGPISKARGRSYVTQGTMDNIDLSKLLGLPTGLRRRERLGGGLDWRPAGVGPAGAAGGPLPSNARVDTFLPYDQLLPHTDVMITNGGFGGVQRALSFGVPLVVAGTTEDKPEVAGRVAWSGPASTCAPVRPRPPDCAEPLGRRSPTRATGSKPRVCGEIIGAGDPLATVADTIESLVSHAGPAVSYGVLDEV